MIRPTKIKMDESQNKQTKTQNMGQTVKITKTHQEIQTHTHKKRQPKKYYKLSSDYSN